ncbi:MAG: phospholipid carrier-dependent glycosyltransferase [Candidatus Moraniibacteriota bacterium]
MKIKKTWYFPLVLLLLGLITHFFLLGQPREVVFDEVHFGGFVSKYFTGQYFFDIHPPLGKLIIATGAKIGGYSEYIETNGPFDFSKIGNQYNNLPVFWFRFFPALAGSLLPLIVFLFLRVIKINEGVAFFAGILIILENSLLTQSRFILLDIFILFFGFLGLYLFFLAREKKYQPLLVFLAGISLAASFSVKWTGLTYLAIALGILAWDFFEELIRRKTLLRLFGLLKTKAHETSNISFGKIFLSVFSLFFAAAIVYISCFYIHFALLVKFTPNDVPNGKLPFTEKFIELNEQMYSSNSGLVAKHPDESTPAQWITLKKPIHYWLESKNNQTSQVIFFGNPLVWLLGILGVLYFPAVWKKIKLKTEIKLFLLVGFWINFIPFLFIKRLLFLYHYLSALVFSIILFSVLFFVLEEKKRIFIPLISTLACLILFSFLVFSNFTYGFPTSNSWQNSITHFFMY